METNPLIVIKNMSKIYHMGSSDTEVRALDDINLTIQRGEFVSIMGPSGSGKSTLMNMLGCLDTATMGEYFLEGIEVSDFSENQLAEIRNQKIGFIFQGFNLIPKLDAFENVELPLVYRGTKPKERRERVIEALNKVGLGDRIHHKPAELSGGQQQRVAIARTLAGSPPLILADEPTGALDTKSGMEIMGILKELNQANTNIILITHDEDVARQARRIVRIQDGKITRDERVS